MESCPALAGAREEAMRLTRYGMSSGNTARYEQLTKFDGADFGKAIPVGGQACGLLIGRRRYRVDTVE